MAYSKQKTTEARSAYVYEALNMQAIARKVNVPLSTVARWKKVAAKTGDDWDKARAAARLSGQGSEAVTIAVLEDFVLLFQSTLDDVKKDTKILPMQKAEIISRLSDAYNKTINAAAKGNPKLNKLAVAMEVLQLFAKHVQNENPELVEPFTDMLQQFGEKLAEVFG